jgi:ornithine cyclodeaminase
MLILTKNNMQLVFTMKDAIAASKEALHLYAEGKTTVPLRAKIDITKFQGQALFMPCFVDEINTIGIKVVSVYPNNHKLGKPSIQAQMMLLDGKTGDILAMLDGTYLTQIRTGALQGLATDILARQDANIAVIFGAGGQASAQVEALLNVRDLTEIRVIDIDFDRAQQFAIKMQEHFHLSKTKFIAFSDSDAAIKDADIVTTITTSKTPVFNGSFIKKGTHINGIGAYTPQMQELPEYIVQHADKIFFDTNHVLDEAGDIIIPLKAERVDRKKIKGELGNILLRKVIGRENDDEITLFKSVGMAVLDVVTAYRIFNQALLFNCGKPYDIYSDLHNY